jgi:EAL domain-containing protein (putative c-di-GMP-specific phosphodiesterase class I)
VYYQPIVDTRTMRIVSCEALARWRRESGEWVSPNDFISVAEERGIINRIDHFVLAHASKFIGEMNRQLEADVGLAVNVSSRLLYLSDPVAQQWLACVRDTRDLRLTIEITERILVEDANRARRVLEELHQEGVSISIDDFGTGYSGLSYFSRFPVTSMKIDRSFVSAIGVSSTEEALIESMLLMAKKLRVKAVAEGVETAEQLQFLKQLDCDYVQGYLIARPMPGNELMAFVQENLQEEVCV